jgi:hypothetical protein
VKGSDSEPRTTPALREGSGVPERWLNYGSKRWVGAPTLGLGAVYSLLFRNPNPALDHNSGASAGGEGCKTGHHSLTAARHRPHTFVLSAVPRGGGLECVFRRLSTMLGGSPFFKPCAVYPWKPSWPS